MNAATTPGGTVSYQPPPPQQPYPQAWPPQQPYAQPAPRRRRRVFPWVFLGIQALFVIWVITGVASGHSAAVNCHDQYLTHAQCASAANAGTAIGAGLIVAFWVAVDVILGIGYGIFRLARRP
jgi:hypothetical protein